MLQVISRALPPLSTANQRIRGEQWLWLVINGRERESENVWGAVEPRGIARGGQDRGLGCPRGESLIMWPTPPRGGRAWWMGCLARPGRAGPILRANGSRDGDRRGRCPRASCRSYWGCRPGSVPSPDAPVWAGPGAAGETVAGRSRLVWCCWIDL